MKVNNIQVIIALTFLAFLGWTTHAEDIEFYGGVYAELTTTVDGSVWVYDATVSMYEPAHIKEFLITTSGAVVDIYGGQIDYMLMVTSALNEFPEAVVTVYGTDFMVDGIPVEPGTPEVFLSSQTLSGTYISGTPFSFMVDCLLMGNSQYIYYQTVKLGWQVSKPDIELDRTELDFGQTEIGSMKQDTVVLYNTGDAALNIQSAQLLQQGDIQFDGDFLHVLPATLAPDEALVIDVSYSPTIESLAEAVLEIVCDDPDESVIEVLLIGEGIPMPVESQIAWIVELYQYAAEEGTLEGVGNAKSAENKVQTFGMMLENAQVLIDDGQYDSALELLLMLEAKCDGQKSPKDFVQGQAAIEVNILVNELIDTLQNP